MAEDVDSIENGVAKTQFVSHTLSCLCILWRHHRCGAHQGQTSNIAYAFVGHERAEGHGSLVVVHGQDGVEGIIIVRAKEVFSRVGAKGVHAVGLQLCDGWCNDVFLFVAPAVAV